MDEEYEAALHEIRQKIDVLDDGILQLLQERFELVKNVQGIKRAHGLPIRQTGRYQSMMTELSKKAKAVDLDQRVVHAVWEAIHDTSIKIQQDAEKADSK